MWKFKVMELYCGIYWEYHRHYDSHHFRLGPGGDFPDGMEEVDNPDCDPAFPKPTPPAFCQRMIVVECLKNNCTYIAYCDGDYETGHRYPRMERSEGKALPQCHEWDTTS